MLNVPVRQGKFQELTGLSKAAIDNKCARQKDKYTGKLLEPVFIEGVHYVIGPDGRRYFNLLVFDAWVRGAPVRELKSLADMSAFELLIKTQEAQQSGDGSVSRSSRRPRRTSSTPNESGSKLRQRFA